MNAIKRFSLERHEGEYATWPSRSRVYFDGMSTDLFVRGYALLHQFDAGSEYLIVTDYDCPFEEITNFILISKRLELLSCRWLGMMYESFLLDSVAWTDARTMIATLYGGQRVRLSIRTWGIPYLWPRLKMSWGR